MVEQAVNLVMKWPGCVREESLWLVYRRMPDTCSIREPFELCVRNQRTVARTYVEAPDGTLRLVELSRAALRARIKRRSVYQLPHEHEDAALEQIEFCSPYAYLE